MMNTNGKKPSKDIGAQEDAILPVSKAYRHKVRSNELIDPAKLTNGIVAWFDDEQLGVRVYAFYFDGRFLSPSTFAKVKEGRARENRARRPWSEIKREIRRHGSLLRSSSFAGYCGLSSQEPA